MYLDISITLNFDKLLISFLLFESLTRNSVFILISSNCSAKETHLLKCPKPDSTEAVTKKITLELSKNLLQLNKFSEWYIKHI